jgi:protein-S-isoprenylcysteine O-methyltransferase Ste14
LRTGSRTLRQQRRWIPWQSSNRFASNASGKSFAVTPQAKELVTLGLYSRIRNPIYVFVDVMIFGSILALHLYCLFVLFPLLVTMHVLRAWREAKVLQEKFGQAYADYRNQTWF